jgi:hypothetical protein
MPRSTGSYAPDVTINGVAALAPATDVAELAKAVQGRPGGSLGSAYVHATYSKTYDDVSFDDYVQVGALESRSQRRRNGASQTLHS